VGLVALSRGFGGPQAILRASRPDLVDQEAFMDLGRFPVSSAQLVRQWQQKKGEGRSHASLRDGIAAWRDVTRAFAKPLRSLLGRIFSWGE